MPYVNSDTRKNLDPAIEELARRVITLGDLNYAITRLAMLKVFDHGAPSYAFLSSIGGVLADARDEFYRRVVAPYEDGKMREHGDVYKQ